MNEYTVLYSRLFALPMGDIWYKRISILKQYRRFILKWKNLFCGKVNINDRIRVLCITSKVMKEDYLKISGIGSPLGRCFVYIRITKSWKQKNSLALKVLIYCLSSSSCFISVLSFNIWDTG